MVNKLTASIKVNVSEELDKKLQQLADSFEVNKSVMVRALLWNVEEIIGYANRDDVDIEYSISLKNGRERIIQHKIEKEDMRKDKG